MYSLREQFLCQDGQCVCTIFCVCVKMVNVYVGRPDQVSDMNHHIFLLKFRLRIQCICLWQTAKVDCVPAVLNKDNIFLQSFLQHRSTVVFSNRVYLVQLSTCLVPDQHMIQLHVYKSLFLLMVFVPRQASELVEDGSSGYLLCHSVDSLAAAR